MNDQMKAKAETTAKTFLDAKIGFILYPKHWLLKLEIKEASKHDLNVIQSVTVWAFQLNFWL